MPAGKHRTVTFLMQLHSHNGFQYLTFPELDALPFVKHLFSTRIGGRSTGDFAEANFSYTRGDRKEHVDANYAFVSEVLGHEGRIDDFVLTLQTHTTNVLHVRKEDCGKGTTRERGYADVDGLITDEPGVILTTMHADCAPVYFVDPVHQAIGLAHSGWRGTVGGISKEVIRKMSEAFGMVPSDLLCAIGPAIGREHYEVGKEVADAFFDVYGDACTTFDIFTPQEDTIKKGEQKFLLDLTKANRMVLERAGVSSDKIFESEHCTYTEDCLFFSHRRQGERRGNMAAFLTLV